MRKNNAIVKIFLLTCESDFYKKYLDNTAIICFLLIIDRILSADKGFKLNEGSKILCLINSQTVRVK
ncbi:MAG: hypothetical protein QME51_03745 [Planctomycetota bacterium]|nr:hypothetical protein [Planctomycetota bacterium]MDI6787461.1 hypothetical protein [Planctomycetota bacterium]